MGFYQREIFIAINLEFTHCDCEIFYYILTRVGNLENLGFQSNFMYIGFQIIANYFSAAT